MKIISLVQSCITLLMLFSITCALHAQRIVGELEIIGEGQSGQHVFTIKVHNNSPYAVYIPNCKLKDQPTNICASLVRVEVHARASWGKVSPACHCGIMSSPPYSGGFEIAPGTSESVKYTIWGDVIPLQQGKTYRVVLAYWVSKKDFDDYKTKKWFSSSQYRLP